MVNAGDGVAKGAVKPAPAGVKNLTEQHRPRTSNKDGPYDVPPLTTASQARQRSTKYVPAGQIPSKSLLFGRRFRPWLWRVMPSKYKSEGIDHRDYGLNDRQGLEVPGF